MSSEDDWLAQLREVYEMDRARREAKEKRQGAAGRGLKGYGDDENAGQAGKGGEVE